MRRQLRTTFDLINQEDAGSRGEAGIMDIFFLAVIGFVVTAFVVFVIASLRLELSPHIQDEPHESEVLRIWPM
jgi:hypothetical protein